MATKRAGAAVGQPSTDSVPEILATGMAKSTRTGLTVFECSALNNGKPLAGETTLANNETILLGLEADIVAAFPNSTKIAVG